MTTMPGQMSLLVRALTATGVVVVLVGAYLIAAEINLLVGGGLVVAGIADLLFAFVLARRAS